MKSLLKFLLLILSFSIFSAVAVYAFMLSLNILKDKKSSIEIDEGKYILMRLLEYNEDILSKKNLDLQREKEALLKQKNDTKDDTMKDEIERKLLDIENRQKNVKDEVKKNQDEKKTYESNLNNIKNELEQKKLEAARLNKEKLELKLQIEKLLIINKELKEGNVLISENEQLKNKILNYEKQLAESKSYWEKYTQSIKIFLQNNGKESDDEIRKGFAKDNGNDYIIYKYRKLYQTLESENKNNYTNVEKIKNQSAEIAKLAAELKNLETKSNNDANYWNEYVKSIKNIIIKNNKDKTKDIETAFSKNNGKNRIIEEYEQLYSSIKRTENILRLNKDHNDKLIIENFSLNDENDKLKKDINKLLSEIADLKSYADDNKSDKSRLAAEISELKDKILELEKRPIKEAVTDANETEKINAYWSEYVKNIRTIIENNYSTNELKKSQIKTGFDKDNGNNYIIEEYKYLYSELAKIKAEIENINKTEKDETSNLTANYEKENKFLSDNLNSLFKISGVNGFFIEKEDEKKVEVFLNSEKTNEILKRGTFLVINGKTGEKYTRIEIQKLSDGKIKAIELPGFTFPKKGDWF